MCVGEKYMEFERFLENVPFSWNKEQKERILTERLNELTKHHRKNCREYDNILKCIGFDEEKADTYMDLPFLPVRLFKEFQLKSVPSEDVVKTMTSSGTTGQMVSKIYLDKATSSNQQKTMVKIVSDFTGSARMPMIIIDCPSVIKDRNMFSARGAGILGFSIFGSKKIYALNDDMRLDVEGLKEFLEKYKGERILLFGFTFMVWQYFYKELCRLKDEGVIFDLSNGVLIHGGGWKKLISEAVSPKEFHDRLQSVCGIESVHDYYGMVEQTGCIYMQCECGHLHASNFSDVIIRNPKDFSECAIGEKGIIQVVSSIPESYPGHSLLTEDEGVILGEDDCPCGRKGKYFSILGRIKNAEIRGCSDTFAANVEMMSQKDEGIVITDTEKIPKGIAYLVGSEQSLADMQSSPSKKLFDETIVSFMNSVSGILMKDRNAKAFPDVVTLAFWLRSASISSLKERFTKTDGNIHMGRGILFHIAPSNVPVNYAYSLFAGLMCGNANVVRVPSKDFPQVGIINAAINEVLAERPEMQPYICLIKYDRNKAINDYLSAICDVRVIWGGDATIAELRKSELRPRSTEVTFADRYSLAVINSDAYLSENSKSRVASDFYNDTFLTDQNACTSPRVVVWTGNRIEEAKEVFWNQLYEYASQKYELPPVRAVDKLSTEYIAAAKYGEKICENEKTDNLIARIKVKDKIVLSPELMNHRGNCGYFYEYDAKDILDIKEICNDVRCQTIGYYGDYKIINPVVESGVKGVDRIVSIGHTMDFDLIWDGYDLTERFCRTIIGK